MPNKDPVLLAVLIETQTLRWFVGGIGMEGSAIPLICSETGNLSPYLSVAFDEQVSFLRHRLSGVLQRGCDRLWGRQKKPCQIVFVADDDFAQAGPELTQAIAEHFVAWMTNPPVIFLVRDNTTASLQTGGCRSIAGEISADCQQALDAGLPALVAATDQPAAWELAPTKKADTNPG